MENTVIINEMKLSKDEIDLLAFALNSVVIRGERATTLISLVDKINNAINDGEKPHAKDSYVERYCLSNEKSQ